MLSGSSTWRWKSYLARSAAICFASTPSQLRSSGAARLSRTVTTVWNPGFPSATEAAMASIASCSCTFFATRYFVNAASAAGSRRQ